MHHGAVESRFQVISIDERPLEDPMSRSDVGVSERDRGGRETI